VPEIEVRIVGDPVSGEITLEFPNVAVRMEVADAVALATRIVQVATRMQQESRVQVQAPAAVN